ncbi:MAG: hypothetical protein ACYSSK_09525, partial [Planctomycetota bacterium]
AVWENGLTIKTQYDKPDDPPSKDATVMITVANPFNEPRIHKNFPGGPDELESYRQEVVAGIHDHSGGRQVDLYLSRAAQCLYPCRGFARSGQPQAVCSV